ncbi:MAG: ParA family protein [SAR324 cluster bacterium]|nr:ParA family protein [SAR324 cluster bacterium]
MKKIVIINQKGGVGKTTTVVNLGDALTRQKKKVLLIDLDPQAHLSYSLGIQAHELVHTVYELIKGESRFKETLITRGKLHLIPSSLELAGSDLELGGIAGREFLLKEALSGVSRYDYVFIDCPPSLNLLTLNALVFAREIFIPVQAEYLALQGMSKLLQTIDVVKNRLNKELLVSGVIGTRFDKRKLLNREIIEQIDQYFAEKLFKTLIRENVSIAEAPSHGKTIFEYKASSSGAEDYRALAQEIIKRK